MQTYEYLAGIVKSALNNAPVSERPDHLSFEDLYDIAIRNHIGYMVFSELIKDKSLTDTQIDMLRNRMKSTVLQTLFQMNELKELQARFEETGVKNIPLKGAVLKYLYPRPETREMSDIDILISSEDAESAALVLNDMGYILNSSIKHHDIYVKKPYMVVEAHKSLYDKSVDGAQYKYFVGFDKAVVREGCAYTYGFTNEDFYVYMIAHAAKHFYAMGCGIRNLIDVYVFLNKYQSSMNMQYVEEELKKCGIYDFEKNVRKLAFDWLEGKELDDFYQSLFQYMLDAGIYGKDENGIWNKFSDDKKEKISQWELRKWYYFPPLYYISEYYPWVEDRPYLLPVAWIIRFWRGVFKHKGAKKREMVRNIKEDQILTYKRIYQRMNLKFSSKS